MKGRSREYINQQLHTSTLAIAFNDRCDAVIARALVAHPLPAPIEPSVIAFLNSQDHYSLGRNNARSLESLS
jgi:hypothetical protein